MIDSTSLISATRVKSPPKDRRREGRRGPSRDPEILSAQGRERRSHSGIDGWAWSFVDDCRTICTAKDGRGWREYAGLLDAWLWTSACHTLSTMTTARPPHSASRDSMPHSSSSAAHRRIDGILRRSSRTDIRNPNLPRSQVSTAQSTQQHSSSISMQQIH